jgi:hypothetical protein
VVYYRTVGAFEIADDDLIGLDAELGMAPDTMNRVNARESD